MALVILSTLLPMQRKRSSSLYNHPKPKLLPSRMGSLYSRQVIPKRLKMLWSISLADGMMSASCKWDSTPEPKLAVLVRYLQKRRIFTCFDGTGRCRTLSYIKASSFSHTDYNLGESSSFLRFFLNDRGGSSVSRHQHSTSAGRNAFAPPYGCNPYRLFASP